MNKLKIFLPLFFITVPAFADDLVCESGMDELYAIFTPKSVNCDSNQFLPANSVSCATCPDGFSCTGGDLVFNEHETSGIDLSHNLMRDVSNVCATNFSSELYATWRPKSITCNAGEYLPMNSVLCASCSQNNYCLGGTYTFNETENQGIEPCQDGTFSPGGTSYCYEHILHIGNDVVYLKSTKLTTPSLNIGMDDGIFYANMTTTPTPMNSATEHYLKIEYGGVIYYVCDDTTLR